MKLADYQATVFTDDTDYSGVMYHANYLKLYERARSQWLLDGGYDPAWQAAHDCLFVVHKCVIDYLRPAALGDALQISTAIVAQRRVGMRFKQEMRLANNTQILLNKAEIDIVCINKAFKPQAVPDVLLKEIR
jgi:acyl-CoA thioester hydrolase